MAAVGELVTLLERQAPDRLDALRSKYPAHVVRLKPGAIMGDGDGETNVDCDIAIQALDLLLPNAEKLRSRLRTRLAWSWRLDLLAKICATVGSGGTLGALASGAGVDKAMLSAIVALVGSLAALLFSYLQRDATSGSIAEAFNELIKAMVDGAEVRTTLPRLCAAGPARQRDEAIRRANEAVRVINVLWLKHA